MNRELVVFFALLALTSTVDTYGLKAKKRRLSTLSPISELHSVTDSDSGRASPTKVATFKAIVQREKASSTLDTLIARATSDPTHQTLFFNPTQPADLSIVRLIGVDGSVDSAGSLSLAELLQRKTRDAQRALESAKKEDEELQDWQLARQKGDYISLRIDTPTEERRKQLVAYPEYLEKALKYVLGGKALFRAIEENPEEVPGLLGTGADPGAYDSTGKTVLSASIQQGAPTTQSLLDARQREAARRNMRVFHGDLPDIETGNSPLITATLQEDELAVHALLNAGVDHCYQNGDGDTAAMIAARLGNQTILETLLARHTPEELRLSNKEGRTALNEASTERGQEAVRRALLSRVSRSIFD
ncbi:ankyrin repeat domain-containing protein [bacterium]|jgi:hypothetical protein|nr:ankyrin repeat domain-containing protein [bacterium]MBT5015520.1 ankyrin repeat domain-containing protein [bacterium]